MQINIASLSYALAFFAFSFLALMLVTVWRGRMHWKVLTFTSVTTAGWAVVISMFELYRSFAEWLPLLEILHSGVWIVFLLILLNSKIESGHTFSQHIKRPYVVFILAFLLFTIITTSTRSYAGQWGSPVVFIINTGSRVILALIGLLLVEHFFRHISEKGRWGIKFACLGIGGLFVYDFYLYSDAMLFLVVNPAIWAARGIVNALCVPLLAISVARDPKWSQGMLISRHILFHSATLFGAALYLIVMAAAGYYLRFFGGSWGAVMQVAFLFGAVILLVVLLFSGSVRAWLKVFISKHFYNYNYDYRDEWIRFTRALSSSGPDLGGRAIQAVASLVESPGAALFICRESECCELSSQWNFSFHAVFEQMDSAFCRLLEDRQWVIDLKDLQSVLYKDVIIPQWLQDDPRAWLVLPLLLHGKLFGFVILAQARSRIKLNWEILDLLKIAGSQAASYLAQQEAANALMVARQFESFNRMSIFMVHDLKNLVSQLSLLLTNAEKHKDNPEFQKDMLETVDHSVQKMKILLQKLSRGADADHKSVVEMNSLLEQVVASKSPYEPRPKLDLPETVLAVNGDRERLNRVFGHIVQNAIEATPKHGVVTVHMRADSDDVLVEIVDTGSGMSAEFVREKLFSPFVSTKVAGMGIGVFETREYIHELGGSIEVISSVNQGSTFKIKLPMIQKVQTDVVQVMQQEKVML
jgi:putative PEP-CTERM system histidine kinase